MCITSFYAFSAATFQPQIEFLFFIKILEAGLLLTVGVIVFIAFFLCEVLQQLTTVLKTRILN